MSLTAETTRERHSSSLETSLAPQWLVRGEFGSGGTAAARPPVPSDLLLAPTVPLRRRAGTWRSKQQLSPRAARATAWLGFLLAIVLPIAFWHSELGTLAGQLRFDVGYLLTGWSGFALIVTGLVMMVPSLPGIRVGVRRSAQLTWGVTLYLLGMLLASQVAAILG